MVECIFCDIARKEKPAELVFENGSFVVFNDIHPKAPVHLLLVPKRHISSIDALGISDSAMMGELFLLAKAIARDRGLAERGYKLLFNVGRGGGQLIDHLHLHMLGGWGGHPTGFAA